MPSQYKMGCTIVLVYIVYYIVVKMQFTMEYSDVRMYDWLQYTV